MANRVHSYPGAGVGICAGVSALAFPPTSYALVDRDLVAAAADAWNPDYGTVPEFDLEIFADGSRALTNATLYGASLNGLVFADITVTADSSTEKLNSVAHGLLTGDGPALLTTTGTFPGGTDGATQYWIVKVDNDNVKLALSLKDALNGVTVDLTSNGTGTIKLVDAASTTRIHWHSHGLLGLAADGTIDLDGQKSYTVKCRHRPRAIAYALTATFGAGSGNVSARIYPCEVV